MRFLTDDQCKLLVPAGHDYACSGINEDAVRREGGRALCAALDRATALIKAGAPMTKLSGIRAYHRVLVRRDARAQSG
jgi:hypothetical protein